MYVCMYSIAFDGDELIASNSSKLFLNISPTKPTIDLPKLYVTPLFQALGLHGLYAHGIMKC